MTASRPVRFAVGVLIIESARFTVVALGDDVEIESVSVDLRATVSGARRPARLGPLLREGTGR